MSSDGSDAIDSSSHGVNHVYIYCRLVVLPARSATPSVFAVLPCALPALKYSNVVELVTIIWILVTLNSDAGDPLNPRIVTTLPVRNP